MPITHRTRLAACCPGELAALPIIMKALMRSFGSFVPRAPGPGRRLFISQIVIGLGVVGSLVGQEPNNSVYLAP
jgi:cyanate permease